MDDITERERAEDLMEQWVAERTAELDRANLTLRMIKACNQALVRVQEERELLQQICATIRRIGGYPMAWVGYAESDEAKTVRPIVWDGIEDGYLEQARITWADEPQGRGPTGTCIRLCEVRLNRDFQTEKDVAPWREKALRRGLRSSLALPLEWGNQVFGALTIYSDRPDGFDRDMVAHLAELAKDLAFGIAAIRSRFERDEARKLAEHRAERLHALTIELVQTERREQEKLAKVLHDDLQQLLVAAKFGVEGLATRLGDDGLRNACGRIEDALAEAIETSRRLATELNPRILHERGLLAGLEWLRRRMWERHGLTVEISADEGPESLAPQHRVLLFDAIRELLFNVVKHAGVDRAEVRLSTSNGLLETTVQDRGAGCETNPIAAGCCGGTGLGLSSIRERLEYLGGGMQMESSPGQGCRYRLTLPLETTAPTSQADPEADPDRLRPPSFN